MKKIFSIESDTLITPKHLSACLYGFMGITPNSRSIIEKKPRKS